MHKSVLRSVIAVALASSSAATAQQYAPWLTQIGVSTSILSAANWGKNQMLGVLDTGIAPANSVFARGQVSLARSGCAAVTFACSNGLHDDGGHGTAVAEIAAGYARAPFSATTRAYSVRAGSVISVAPNANILSQKVLDSSGSGYDTDLASGIFRAADAGASVINVSISYGRSAQLVAAINYAAARGAFIVWAGGNNGAAFAGGANSMGLSSAALTHLVFAGSVNARNQRSFFSARPGSGALVSGSGAALYATRWIMAPGEGIMAPFIGSPSGWASWTGTSMSAPIVSGTLILLQSAWPILRTNGTAANLLLATASDLGTRGVDTVYGAGLVNLATAFRPYGTLNVTQANGRAIALPRLTGTLITGGALGSLSSVRSRLANYTAFDGYQRNFSVDLSGLIRSRPVAARVNALPTNRQTGPTPVGFAGGFDFDAELARDWSPAQAAFTTPGGTTLAFAQGVPAAFSYGNALYGRHDFARLSSELGAAHLSSLAQDGAQMAFGMRLSKSTRVAFSWSGSAPAPSVAAMAPGEAWAMPEASSVSVGLAHRVANAVTAGITFGTLTEKHGLLGTVYDPGSPLSLGASSRSSSLGLSAAFEVGPKASVLLEASVARTAGGSADGLFAGTTDIESHSYGAALMLRDVLKAEDRLTFSAKQPLRVVAGQAGVVVPGVDERGVARYSTEWVSLVPEARELDYRLSYDRLLGKSQTLSLQTCYRRGVMNMSGASERALGLTWALRY